MYAKKTRRPILGFVRAYRESPHDPIEHHRDHVMLCQTPRSRHILMNKAECLMLPRGLHSPSNTSTR